MKKLTMSKAIEIEAEGKLSGGNCKMVYCITAHKFFTSMTDAARWLGVSIQDLCHHLKGKTKTIRGHRFCYVSEIMAHMNEIAAQGKCDTEEKEKAAKWDALMAEQEAARKAEEKRIEEERKAEEKRIAELEKAKAKKLRQQEMYERTMAKANELLAAIAATESEINNLEGKEEVA